KNITGKDAENALVAADITVNKNMVPFDNQSPFVTSGIRIGTAAITTRGFIEKDMEAIANLIDRVISNAGNDAEIQKIQSEVTALTAGYPLFCENFRA